MSARATKAVAVAILAAIWAVGAAGCVSIGYDFINQRATLTFDAKTVKEPTK
jgi:hypothetical protein